MYLQDPLLGLTSSAMKRDFHGYLNSATIMTYHMVSIPTGHRLSGHAGTVRASHPTHGHNPPVVEEY